MVHLRNSHNLKTANCKHEYGNVFSQAPRNGNSWTVFPQSVEDKGAVLVMLRDGDGYVFGGFAGEELISKPKVRNDK